MAEKPIVAKVRLQLQGGNATPAPPVGTSLGPHGVNLPLFCKSFNDKTKGKEDYIFRVFVTVYKDRSFDFIIKSPPTSMLIKKAAGIAKGSSEPSKKVVAKLSKNQIMEIAKTKMEELNAYNVEEAMKIIEGTARSMGIKIEE